MDALKQNFVGIKVKAWNIENANKLMLQPTWVYMFHVTYTHNSPFLFLPNGSKFSSRQKHMLQLRSKISRSAKHENGSLETWKLRSIWKQNILSPEASTELRRTNILVWERI